MTPQTPQGAALSDADIDKIALEVTYEGDTSIPYRQDWCETTGRPFARAIEAAVLARLTAEQPDCWAVLTPNGSKLVSPDEAKGRKDAYPLYARAPVTAEHGGADRPSKAIEFAEYMAKDAERLLDAINEHAAAVMGVEGGSDDDSDADISELKLRVEHAEQALSDCTMHMRSGIYEFRKRAALTTQPQAAEPAAIPAILFDGFAVLQALPPERRARTSPENVGDVLDAVVKILRATPTAPTEPT